MKDFKKVFIQLSAKYHINITQTNDKYMSEINTFIIAGSHNGLSPIEIKPLSKPIMIYN